MGFLFGSAFALTMALVGLALSVAVLVWAYRDAERRGVSGLLVAILVAVTGFVGALVWLLVRPALDQGPVYNERGGRVV